jgi:hypothetical protein
MTRQNTSVRFASVRTVCGARKRETSDAAALCKLGAEGIYSL